MRTRPLLSVTVLLGALALPAAASATANPDAAPVTTLISTFAGTGTFGFSGDGGPATEAQLAAPFGLTVTPDGSVYIADAATSRIRKVDAQTQHIGTVAGNGGNPFGALGDGGPATGAPLQNPHGVAVAPDGSVYIADTGHGRVRKVDAQTHIISTVAGTGSTNCSGNGGQATAAALYPVGVAVGPGGSVYIADQICNRIWRVAADGVISTVAGTGSPGYGGDGGLATAAQFSPQGVAVASDGNMYIGDFNNYRIRKVDADTGIITTVAGDGTSGFSGDGGPATAAGLGGVARVAVSPDGSLYLAETNRIRKVDAGTGIITTVAGTGAYGFSGDGGPATAAQLAPIDVAVAPDGRVLFTDTNNQRVRQLAEFAAPALTATPPATDAQRSGTIAFTSVAGATFRCSLAAAGAADNDRTWTDCDGTYAYGDLADGAYEFRARAFTAGGAASRTASRTWTVDGPDAPTDPANPTNPVQPVKPANPANPATPLTLAKPQQNRTLRSALAGRIHVVVRCTRQCELAGTMTVSNRVARELGLGSRTVGTVRGHGRGPVLLPVRLNQRAARALRRHPRTLLVQVTVRDAPGHRVVQTVRLTLKTPTS